VEALAEAFGLMLVQVEAREYRATLLIDQLRESNARLERALEELDRKTRLMVIMVHELKSPVASAKMMVDLLKFQNPDNEPVAAVSEKIGARMDKLLALIAEIMQLFRASGEGGAPQRAEEVDVTAEAAAILAENREQAAGKGLSIVLDAPDAPVKAWFPPRILNLAMSNLVSNAVKYTPEGSVRVSVSQSGGHVEICVNDTGLGIPEKDMKNLFKPFFRATNVRKSSIAGTGIGLSSIKDLVTSLGGTLDVRSEENAGSTFTLRIPSPPVASE